MKRPDCFWSLDHSLANVEITFLVVDRVTVLSIAVVKVDITLEVVRLVTRLVDA